MFDLRKEVGNRYRIQLDDSYSVEKCEGKAEEIAHYMEIHGKRGWLYPFDDSRLGVEIRPKLVRPFTDTFGPDATVKRRCDEGTTFLVSVAKLRAVLSFIRATKRRQLSDAQKTAMAARLVAYRAGKAKKAA